MFLETTGTATNTAWRHCPGDPMATGNAATNLIPGDTVIFKGGVSYVLTGASGISLKWSGTADNPITYDGNSAGSWGTGQAILTDNAGIKHISAIYAPGALSGVAILNFSIGPIGGYSPLPADTGTEIDPNIGYGIGFAGKVTGVTIGGCYVHELGVWQNKKPAGNSVDNGEGDGIYFGQDFNGVTVTNCEFTKLQTALTFVIHATGSNAIVANCYFHDYLRWCIDFPVTAAGANMDNIFIYSNRLIDVDKYYSAGIWSGYGGVPWHQDGIIMRGESVTLAVEEGAGTTDQTFNCGTNIQIYNNVMQDTTEYTGGSSGFIVSGGVNANVYNNLFINLNEANGALSYSEPPWIQSFKFNAYNNTFYGNSGIQMYWAGIPNAQKWRNNALTWPPTNTLHMYNNILYDQGTNIQSFLMGFNATNYSMLTCFKFDHNCYRTLNFGGGVNGIADWIDAAEGGFSWLGYLPFSQLKAFGWESNGILADPLFVNAAGGDFQLQTNSPVIGLGMNLTSLNLPGLTNDISSNPRLGNAPWTLGAFLPIGSSLAPYVSLVVTPSTIVNGQSTTLTWMSLNATNLVLGGTGEVALNGNMTISPTKNNSKYVITATGTNGTQSASVLVSVRPTPIPGPPTPTPQ
jgi:hypothetical protein